MGGCGFKMSGSGLNMSGGGWESVENERKCAKKECK